MSDEITPQPFDAAALSDDELNAEHERIQTRGAELSSTADLDEAGATELTELAGRADAVASEQTVRSERAASLATARERFAVQPDPVAPAAPVAPVIEPTAVVKATETAAAVVVPSVAEMSNVAPVVPTRTAGNGVTAYVSPGAAGYTDKDAGKEFSGLTEISQAMIQVAESFGRRGGGKGMKTSIAQFQRERGAELTVSEPGNRDSMAKLQYARREARLHGGSLAKQWQHNIDQGASLTAAAGWCAPSENRYDLCQLWGAGVGILDVPTITVRRGGLNYTDEPSFADIYANAIAAGGGSNHLTEAEVIADTPKTCSEVPCPVFEDRRLDVLALCIRVSLLQAAGYPELVNTWTDGLLAANEQEMNRLIIADMVARGGAATTVTAADLDGDSFTSAVLAAVELAAEDIRYREMMPFTSTVEIVLPHWVIPQIRADLSRRTGVDLLGVSDSMIASLFSVRNVRVQFVRGYQDGLITGGALAPTLPGGDAATPFLAALPSTVNFIAYPAGAVAVARQDVITLTNVYDAASLATNEFTALFAEEGFAPVYPCPGIRNYTVAGCVAGITGATVIDCTDTP